MGLAWEGTCGQCLCRAVPQALLHEKATAVLLHHDLCKAMYWPERIGHVCPKDRVTELGKARDCFQVVMPQALLALHGAEWVAKASATLMLVEQDAALSFRDCGREELKVGPFPSDKESCVCHRWANFQCAVFRESMPNARECLWQTLWSSFGVSVFLLTSL